MQRRKDKLKAFNFLQILFPHESCSQYAKMRPNLPINNASCTINHYLEIIKIEILYLLLYYYQKFISPSRIYILQEQAPHLTFSLTGSPLYHQPPS